MALVLSAAQPDPKRSAEANLRKVNEQIEQIARRLQTDVVEKDKANKALRDAERLVSRATGDLSTLRARRAERAASRERLAEERSRRQGEREATQEDLARQLRAAYFMGRSEPLKLLLNQRNPAEIGRNLTYYGYLGRLRAGQINAITQSMAKIDELTAKIEAEDAELASLEVQRKQQVNELESAKRERGKALTNLEQESRGRASELNRLQTQRKQIEQLMRELNRATESAPYYPNTPFAKLRGKLSWPVAGRIAANPGADGVQIDADAGDPVRAVHEGVVTFADWFPGRGLTIVIKHGGGYFTVYGHNAELFKAVGAEVAAGERIATVGNTGGRSRPGLHFEIRQFANSRSNDSKSLNPRPWFRTTKPPGG